MAAPTPKDTLTREEIATLRKRLGSMSVTAILDFYWEATADATSRATAGKRISGSYLLIRDEAGLLASKGRERASTTICIKPLEQRLKELEKEFDDFWQEHVGYSSYLDATTQI